MELIPPSVIRELSYTKQTTMVMNNYQSLIMEYLSHHDSAEVSELGELLKISASTVRRQLTEMENKGLIIRVHGGARLPTPITYELPYEERLAEAIDSKRAIAARARVLVAQKLVIGLSGGTTCTELARQLRSLENLTIVTNAINIALELKGKPYNRLMVTGGMLNQNSYELVGNQVSQSLQSVHIDLAFLGVSGINVDFGFSMSDEQEAVAGRAFMKAADHTIIIADHTKIGKSTFARLCSLDAVDMLITDDHITQEQKSELTRAGLEVEVASMKNFI